MIPAIVQLEINKGKALVSIDAVHYLVEQTAEIAMIDLLKRHGLG